MVRATSPAFTCQAGLDEPDLNDALPLSAPVDIEIFDDQETIIDL
jgi:hypothetical protein